MEIKRKVYSRFDVPETKEIGNFPKEIDVFTEEIDQNGRHKLVKAGKTNFYQKIQSYKNETMIYNLLDRFKNGDVNALNKNKNAIYGDFSKAPTSIQEAHRMVQNAKKEFEKLPIHVKDEFGQNYNEFLAAAQNGSLKSRLEKAQGISSKSKELETLKNLTSNTPKTNEILPGQTTLEKGITYES